MEGEQSQGTSFGFRAALAHLACYPDNWLWRGILIRLPEICVIGLCINNAQLEKGNVMNWKVLYNFIS